MLHVSLMPILLKVFFSISEHNKCTFHNLCEFSHSKCKIVNSLTQNARVCLRKGKYDCWYIAPPHPPNPQTPSTTHWLLGAASSSPSGADRSCQQASQDKAPSPSPDKASRGWKRCLRMQVKLTPFKQKTNMHYATVFLELYFSTCVQNWTEFVSICRWKMTNG